MRPTADWKVMPNPVRTPTFTAATDLYYIDVAVLDAAGHPVK